MCVRSSEIPQNVKIEDADNINFDQFDREIDRQRTSNGLGYLFPDVSPNGHLLSQKHRQMISKTDREISTKENVSSHRSPVSSQG